MVDNAHGTHVDAVVDDMEDASCDPLDMDSWVAQVAPSCSRMPQGGWDEVACRVAYVTAASLPCQEGSEDSHPFAVVDDAAAFSSSPPCISDAVASFVTWHSTPVVRGAVR